MNIYLITGFLASGKSIFCRILEQHYKFKVINCDAIAKSLLSTSWIMDLIINKIVIANNYNQEDFLEFEKRKRLILLDAKFNNIFINFFWPILNLEVENQVLKFKKQGYKNVVVETLDLKCLNSWNPKKVYIQNLNAQQHDDLMSARIPDFNKDEIKQILLIQSKQIKFNYEEFIIINNEGNYKKLRREIEQKLPELKKTHNHIN